MVDVECTTALRLLAVDAVQQANSGHPGLPLGAADIVYTIFSRFMNINPASPAWPNRDRFVLSCGHGSAMLYSLLHLLGYPKLTLEQLQHFRQWGSLTPGHPERDVEMGIETTTGPLGQGFGNAVGLALAERIVAGKLNKPDFPIMDHFTYVLVSDGDLMEGISHEVGSWAGHLGLGRLIALYDDNGISIDGRTDITCSDNAPARFAAYGWHVQTVDGHNIAEIEAAINSAKAVTDRPSFIACKTHIGLKSPAQDTNKVHGTPLGDDGLRKTKAAFGWPAEAKFSVPDAVRAQYGLIGARGAAKQREWDELFARYKSAFPELGVIAEQMFSGHVPIPTDFPAFPPGSSFATRVASQKVLDVILPKIPNMIGGSADLTPSNNTFATGSASITKNNFNGNYLHYGIREHSMGSVMNGLALHYLRPYGGAFLVFSDYMRPPVRSAAMMHLPVVYVWTHDSIGLGEDGPTHQPIEQLASLRLIPNLAVVRPCDANETAEAWRLALSRNNGPTAIILSRQNLPTQSPVNCGVSRGGYILIDVPEPKVVLIATGSEVSIAVEAQGLLAKEDIPARVVSMPCWEMFDAQQAEYRNYVLPPKAAKLSIEAGRTLGWEHYTGSQGACIGLDHWGASAPYLTLYREFGLTSSAVLTRAKSLLS
ncbi:transketolase 2, thiamin-binding [Pelomyxa schiedti]|nr:transketolase 2, thiamin-binding [Pelomyxa schiedti]